MPKQLVLLVRRVSGYAVEHMFFEGIVFGLLEFILAEDEKSRKSALSKLLKHQQKILKFSKLWMGCL